MAQRELTVLPFSPEVLIVCNGAGPDYVGICLPEHLRQELRGSDDSELTASIVDGVLTIQKSDQ